MAFGAPPVSEMPSIAARFIDLKTIWPAAPQRVLKAWIVAIAALVHRRARSLQLSVGEKPDPSSVQQPGDRTGRTFRAGEWPRFDAVERPFQTTDRSGPRVTNASI